MPTDLLRAPPLAKEQCDVPFQIGVALDASRMPGVPGVHIETMSLERSVATAATASGVATQLPREPRARNSRNRWRLADCGRRPGHFFTRRVVDNTTSNYQGGVATTARNHPPACWPIRRSLRDPTVARRTSARGDARLPRPPGSEATSGGGDADTHRSGLISSQRTLLAQVVPSSPSACVITADRARGLASRRGMTWSAYGLYGSRILQTLAAMSRAIRRDFGWC